MIDPVAQAAARLWGLDPADVRLAAKRENAVYQVGDYALRLHRPGYRSDAQLESELAWMNALAAGGLRVPQPLALPDGRRIAVVQDVQVDVLSWLPGAPAGHGSDLVVADRIGFCQSLGRLFADLHRISDAWSLPSGFDRPKWDLPGLLGETPVWGRFWDHPDLTPDARAICVAARHRATRELAKLEPDLDYGLIHADGLCENIMVAEGMPSLIDFDDSGFGFRTFDIATFLMRLLDVPDYADLRRALLQGYAVRRVIPETEVDLFIVLRALTYPGWIISRMTEPGGPERSARALATALPLARRYLELRD